MCPDVAARVGLHLQESYPLAEGVRGGCFCFLEHVLLCMVLYERPSAAPLEVRLVFAYRMTLPLRVSK